MFILWCPNRKIKFFLKNKVIFFNLLNKYPSVDLNYISIMSSIVFTLLTYFK